MYDQLAQPTLLSGKDEALAVADTYGDAIALGEAGSPASSEVDVRVTKVEASELTKELHEAKQGAASEAEANARMSEALGPGVNVNSLPVEYRETFFKTLNEAVDTANGLATDPSGTAVEVYEGTRFPQAQGVMAMADTLIENVSETVDRYVIDPLMTSTLEGCFDCGLVDYVGKMLEKINVLGWIGDFLEPIGKAIKSVIDRGHVALLTTAARWLPTGWVRAMFPNAVKDILRKYKFPLLSPFYTMDTIYADLISDLETYDPNWMWWYRNGEKIPNLEPFTWASEDAVAVLLHKEPTATNVMIAKSHPDRLQKRVGEDYYRTLKFY